MINAEEIAALLRAAINQVCDPCALAQGVRIGLADMGLIRSIDAKLADGKWDVSIQMRLTSPGCFYFVYFEDEIRSRAHSFSQIRSLQIEWDNVFDWTPNDMSETARAKLKDLRKKMIS